MLVEAKAHLEEFLGPPCAAGEQSRVRIARAMEGVRESLGASPGTNWTRRFYQYANRLAHLDFLRRNGVDAILLLVNFTGDIETDGPQEAAE